MTSTFDSLPHVRHGRESYGDAVTQVTLQKIGEIAQVYTVSSDDVLANASDIVLLGNGPYGSTGTFYWTIEATGYQNATVTVIVE